MGAGDTFRAASIEQLEEHGENLDVKVISHEYESDPAAVGYDTVEHAENEDKVALVDTAGRSHADQNLMNELDKMIRVNEPDVTFLVVDALAGNDVLEQAEAYEGMFDAVIVTKMDVDENGGAIISISQRSGKPVAFIGTGQGYEDLEEFDKESFVESIL
ncbi:MAG: signal recognition particle-docking protein FtsY, partial [Candidatus Nanohaloarchaea archaeon]